MMTPWSDWLKTIHAKLIYWIDSISRFQFLWFNFSSCLHPLLTEDLKSHKQVYYGLFNCELSLFSYHHNESVVLLWIFFWHREVRPWWNLFFLEDAQTLWCHNTKTAAIAAATIDDDELGEDANANTDTYWANIDCETSAQVAKQLRLQIETY